jgi:hypothetical protein
MHFALVINVNLCMMSNTPPPLKSNGTNLNKNVYIW